MMTKIAVPGEWYSDGVSGQGRIVGTLRRTKPSITLRPGCLTETEELIIRAAEKANGVESFWAAYDRKRGNE